MMAADAGRGHCAGSGRGSTRNASSYATVEAFDLPYVGLDAQILNLAHRSSHQCRSQLDVEYATLISAHAVQLLFFRGHNQLEHEIQAVLMAIVGDAFQPGDLLLVAGRCALRIVMHQHLGKRRREGRDMVGKLLAVVELELVMPALLGGHDGQP